MKFKKKITVCRHDDGVLFQVIQKTVSLNKCCSLKNGICMYDNRKCKIITYVREI